MDCITKIYDAITACQEQNRQPKCILCRFSFYEALIEECDKLSFVPVRVGVQTLGGANTIFGIRLARTPDIDNDVKLFEVIV